MRVLLSSLAAAAYHLQAVDMVFIDLQDEAGLAAEATLARQLGYTGKMAIHPRQVAIINRAFSPSQEETEKAQRLVDAYQAQACRWVWGVYVKRPYGR